MIDKPILWHIKQLRRPIFTTHELCASSGKSASAVVQTLNFLEKAGIILKVYRGIWIEEGHEKISPYSIIPFLFPRHRAYVSFISALHLYGIIEQIPQIVTLASTIHSKTIRTKLGDFHVHKINPLFFTGFNWYKDRGDFLIAEPEKALIDSLYLSTRKKRQFGHFPELRFSKSFSFKKAENWIKKIPNRRIRASVQKKFTYLVKH